MQLIHLHYSAIGHRDTSAEIEVKGIIPTYLIERLVEVSFHYEEIAFIHNLVLVRVPDQGADFHVVIGCQWAAISIFDPVQGDTNY